MTLEAPVTDPQHYTANQYKVIHPLDREWLETGDEPVDRQVMECLARSA